MNALILLCAMAGVGQTTLPRELDRSTFYLADLPVGESIRVYKEAMVVDEHGRSYLRGDWVADMDRYSQFNRHKELEVIHNKLGWIVRVHYYWHPIGTRSVMRYPQWTRSRVPRPTDIPVKGLAIVRPPSRRMSQYEQLDNYYRSLSRSSAYRQ